MSTSKVFRVLGQLSKADVEELDKQLVGNKRETTYCLFATLAKPALKGLKEPDKQSIFSALYGKPYTKEEDYLLRNEYRLLFKEVVRYVSYKEWSRQHEPLVKIKYLEYLLRNEQYELLEEEINEAWGTAHKNQNIELLLVLYDLRIMHNINAKPQSLAVAEETLALSKERAKLVQFDLLRKLRMEETKTKMAERIIKAYKPSYELEPFFGVIDLNTLQEQDEYAQHLFKRANVNLLPPEERIALLKEVINDTPVISRHEAEPEKTLVRFYAILAQEYYIKGAYSDAFAYFEKAMPLIKQLPANTRDAFVFNYLMAMLKGGQQQKASAVGDKYKDSMFKSPLLKNRVAFLFVMLHLFNKQADEAERYIDLDSKHDGTEFYYHMRLALSFVYYLRGQLELAERECNNLEQALNYEMRKEGNSQTELNKTLNKMFRRFYALQIEGQATGKKELAEPLRELMDNVRNGHGFDSIFVQLIEREVA